MQKVEEFFRVARAGRGMSHNITHLLPGARRSVTTNTSGNRGIRLNNKMEWTKLSELSPPPTMRTINIHQAKTNLSWLIQRALQGEPFVIAKAGKPLVKVTALGTPEQPAIRRTGFLAGEIRVPDDFDFIGHESTRLAIGDSR
jgi:antitoxin (DNA-binding transcriptional repressor) of toxin-antitoxin stability system